MASIATILALNPLVCSYAAATQEVTNAALVFSLTELFEGGPAGYTNVTSAVLCARNMSDTPVVVRLIVENRSFPSPSDFDEKFTLQPRDDPNRQASHACQTFTALPPLNGFDASLRPIGAMIVLVSPERCSQATEYPGNCGVFGSFELIENYASVRARISSRLS